jgi:branched-chain amino acid transport system substrate-binding protein
MVMSRRRAPLLVGAAVLTLVAAACGSGSSKGSSSGGGSKSSAPGITAKTINIGFIYSATGIASASYVNAYQGALARLDAQNAAGGVDGRQLKLVVKDDQSSLTGMSDAAHILSGSTFAIIPLSSFTFAAAKTLQQAGVPVVGYAVDGPEWGQQPYTNMFSFSAPTSTPFSGTYYTYTDAAQFLKSLGVTKMANLAYGISPSAVQATKDFEAAATAVGMSEPKCYNNLSVPFGSSDFTADALAISQAKCDGVEAALVDNSDIAISQALKNEGLTSSKITQLYYTGYSQAVLDNPSTAASYEGAYVLAGINFTTPNAAVHRMLDNLQKYVPGAKSGQIPDYGVQNAYVAMDLMIDGLQHAGSNPTRTSFIDNLHQVSNYTANGIFPSPGVSFSLKGFATVAMLPETACTYIVHLVGDQFVPVNGGKLICGQRIAVPK